ncbi:MAG: hypothetical protein V1820_01095 [archaeon]
MAGKQIEFRDESTALLTYFGETPGDAADWNSGLECAISIAREKFFGESRPARAQEAAFIGGLTFLTSYDALCNALEEAAARRKVPENAFVDETQYMKLVNGYFTEAFRGILSDVNVLTRQEMAHLPASETSRREKDIRAELLSLPVKAFLAESIGSIYRSYVNWRLGEQSTQQLAALRVEEDSSRGFCDY